MRTAVVIALVYVLLMRLFELGLSRRNARIALASGAQRVEPDGMLGIVIVHTAFWIGLAAEELLLGGSGRSLSPPWLLVFAATEAMRFVCIATLGARWNVRVLVWPGLAPVRKGIYSLLPHPNYVAVVLGLAALPLGLGLYWTALLAPVAKLLVLPRRIRIEARALTQAERGERLAG